jgi:hypothetical protein
VDSPTAVSTGAGSGRITPFSILPGAAQAAATARTAKMHVMPSFAVNTPAPGHHELSTRGTSDSPFDLTASGGPVVTTATSENIYVNCPSGNACWSSDGLTPAGFLADLNVSHLLTTASQYIGENAPGHFSANELSTTATLNNNTMTLNDLFSVLFSAASTTGATGYTAIYHVFLPQGTDMCIRAKNCYSPDSLQNFQFCAFHSAVTFITNTGNLHVQFTVEPYQGVNGCVAPTQTRLIDATASTLSHEFFEAITDPDLDEWFNWLTGNEIADICIGLRPVQRVGHHDYAVQEEYSNAAHACTIGG